MCIRITKELKHVYESVLSIDLSKKIQYSLFLQMLTVLGYLDKKPLPGAQEEKIVQVAWQSIRTHHPPHEIHGYNAEEEAGPDEEMKKEPQLVESTTFENFAMLLNLINNVYIKNSVNPKSANEVIEEEEDAPLKRPFGYVDAQGRFMASSQAEVDKIYRKFLPLMLNKRKN